MILSRSTARSPLTAGAPVPSTMCAFLIAKLAWLILESSRACEFCGTLFEERTHAFPKIRRATGFALHLMLEVELLLVAVLVAVPIELANQAERDGRAAGEVARQLLRLVEQLRIVDHAIDETPFQRLLGGQFLAHQRKLHRASTTDEPRQNPRRAAVGHQTDATKRLEKICRARAHHQVAHQRE